jgi:hypothetical protein
MIFCTKLQIEINAMRFQGGEDIEAKEMSARLKQVG